MFRSSVCESETDTQFGGFNEDLAFVVLIIKLTTKNLGP